MHSQEIRKQAAALSYQGVRQEDIAKQLHIGRRTLVRWITHDPVFRSHYQALSEETTQRYREMTLQELQRARMAVVPRSTRSRR